MEVKCDLCSGSLEVPYSEKRSLPPVGPFVCSKSCVFEWLRRLAVQLSGPVCKQKVALEIALLCCGVAMPSEPSGTVWSNVCNMFFRSRFERVFAEFLFYSGITFDYEPFVVAIGGVNKPPFFIPDFYIPAAKAFIEVKGGWKIGDKKKIKDWNKKVGLSLLVVHWLLRDQFFPEEEKCLDS